MRHSISVGGRFLPPPKYWSYSIFSWRISRSSCPSSSSIVAMDGPDPRSLHARIPSQRRQRSTPRKRLMKHRTSAPSTCPQGQRTPFSDLSVLSLVIGVTHFPVLVAAPPPFHFASVLC